jgi:hypothetical protein
LKPVAAADYTVSFSPDEFARLNAIFPNGVCDWSRPGVNQKELKDSWLVYPEPGRAVRLDQEDGHRKERD